MPRDKKVAGISPRGKAPALGEASSAQSLRPTSPRAGHNPGGRDLMRMAETTFQIGPRCGKTLEAGFAHNAPGLSFVAQDKLQYFIFLDEDVVKSGLSKLLHPAAAFFKSNLCRFCS
ncbi:MAG: hypothetical protein O3C60_20070 [Planctomycetota bacterium]|nr:hypothetical protein [Planctomycetota bacterium]